MGNANTDCSEPKSKRAYILSYFTRRPQKLKIERCKSQCFDASDDEADMITPLEWDIRVMKTLSHIKEDDVPYWSIFKPIFLNPQILPQRPIQAISPKKQNILFEDFLNDHNSTFSEVCARDLMHQKEHQSTADLTIKRCQTMTECPTPRYDLCPSEEKNQQKNDYSMLSTKATSQQTMILSHHYGKDELRGLLKYDLECRDHFLKILLKEFHKVFRDEFEKDLQKLVESEFSEANNLIFKDICSLVRCFVWVTRELIIWMYEKLISQCTAKLEAELTKIEWIVESVIYEKLFNNPCSILVRILTGLIRRKQSRKIKKLKREMRWKRCMRIQKDKELIKSYPMFALKNEKKAYQDVVDKIYEIKKEYSPYTIFESISSIEAAVFRCVEEYYKGDSATIMKLVENFDRDVKILIIKDCILKSQNNDLFTRLSLAERFVDQSYIEQTQGFWSFGGILNYLIEGK